MVVHHADADVFAACARESRGSAVTAPAAARWPVTVYVPAHPISPPLRPGVLPGLVQLIGRCDQRAAALGERAEGLVGRRWSQQLVVVPGVLALVRRLHLEQVRRDASCARPARIVPGPNSRRRSASPSSLRPPRAPLPWPRRAQSRRGLQVVQRRRRSRRPGPSSASLPPELRRRPFGEGARAVVEVPVEGLGAAPGPAPSAGPARARR